MFKMFIVLFFFFLSTNIAVQSQTIPTGVWKGKMMISKSNQLTDSVEVILTVRNLLPDSSWQWKMEYKSDKMPVTKDYKLIVSDKKKGIYLTDEGEGVVLMNYLHGNKMYGIFETGGFLLTSTTEWFDNQIVFEVTSGKKQTGAINDITNYAVSFLQKAILIKTP